MARPLADPELRRKIAITVFQLVAQSGIDGMSMRAVAAATGLSTGTLNYHFGNKQGLVHFAVDYAYATPRDWSEHTGSTASGLRRLARRYLLRRPEVRDWWRFWCALTAHASKDTELASWQAESHRVLVAFFVGILRAGIERGEVDASLDVEAEGERFVALAHGLALRQLVDPGPAVTARARSLLEAEILRLCTSRTNVRL